MLPIPNSCFALLQNYKNDIITYVFYGWYFLLRFRDKYFPIFHYFLKLIEIQHWNYYSNVEFLKLFFENKCHEASWFIINDTGLSLMSTFNLYQYVNISQLSQSLSCVVRQWTWSIRSYIENYSWDTSHENLPIGFSHWLWNLILLALTHLCPQVRFFTFFRKKLKVVRFHAQNIVKIRPVVFSWA